MPSRYSRGKSELRAGALVASALLLFTALFLYLTDRGFNWSKRDLYVRLPIAEQVRKGDGVMYLGVRVGEVADVGFAPDSGVLVHTRLARDVPLRRVSHATLQTPEMLGGQVLVIHQAPATGPVLEDGDTIPGYVEPSLMEQVAVFADRVGGFVNDTVAAATLATIGGTAELAANANALMERTERGLDEHGAAVAASLSRLHTLIGRLDSLSHETDVGALQAELEQAARSLTATAARADSAAARAGRILGRLEEGDGTLGALLSDRALYDDVQAAARSLRSLAEAVKAEPGRFIKFSLF